MAMTTIIPGVIVPINQAFWPARTLFVSALVTEVHPDALTLLPVHGHLKYATETCLILGPDQNSLHSPLVIVCRNPLLFPHPSTGAKVLTISGNILQAITAMREPSLSQGLQTEFPRGAFAGPASRARVWNEKLATQWQSFHVTSWGTELLAFLSRFPEDIAPSVERMARQGISQPARVRQGKTRIEEGPLNVYSTEEEILYPKGPASNERLKFAAEEACPFETSGSRPTPPNWLIFENLREEHDRIITWAQSEESLKDLDLIDDAGEFLRRLTQWARYQGK